MRIGELADRAGLATKTIRYYEEAGILDEPARMTNGYRNYDVHVLERLRFVRASQAIGLTLGEIREVLALRDDGVTPCAHVAQLIEDRRADIDVKIGELQRMRDELERIARRARKLNPTDCEPEDICHIIER